MKRELKLGEYRHPRAYYADRFPGSAALFRACWRDLLSLERANGPVRDLEVMEVLNDSAAALVNDETSKFYIYG